MRAGDYGEMLLGVARQLCDELRDQDDPLPSGLAGLLTPPRGGLEISHDLDAGDREVVENLRGALAEIAIALWPDQEEPSVASAVAALDGAESVIGAELLRGNPQQLPRLMPSFVFLVALQVAGQDRAFELSQRVTELIEEAA